MEGREKDRNTGRFGVCGDLIPLLLAASDSLLYQLTKCSLRPYSAIAKV